MKRFTSLKISCKTNPDLNGNWHANAVEDEMDSIGMDPIANSWIEFVIGHFDFPAEIDDIVTNDDILSFTARINNDVVNFIKQ